MIKRIINCPKIIHNLNDISLLLVVLTIIWGTIVYYLYALNLFGIIISLILIIASFVILYPYWNKRQTITADLQLKYQYQIKHKIIPTLKSKILIIIYALLYLILIQQLFLSRTSRAIISPWQVVGQPFFYLYFLISLVLILILLQKTIDQRLKIILVSAQYLISFSIAMIVYKIAYGFDPIIHQATMELIAKKGFVLPKTPYYLGEYSLIIIIHRITSFSIAILNKILVPGLTALFLPTALYRFLKNKNKNFPLALLFLLILGFSPFILSTPQNLSYLFLLLTVLASFNYPDLSRVYLLAIATAAIHPVTGLPALIFVLWLSFKKYQQRLKPLWQKITKTFIFILMGGAIPGALVIGGGGHWQTINHYSWSFFSPLKDLIAHPIMAGQEDVISNFIYFLASNYNIFIIIAILMALLYYYQVSVRDRHAKIVNNSLVVISFALLFSYLLSKQIIFKDLISYEQANYSQRLPIIIMIFLSPFLIRGLNNIIIKIRQQKKMIQIIFLTTGLILLTTSLYLSYPRWDKYWNSHGYSTSQNDILAVQSIAQNAQQQAYLVLADQQVSAAALKEFGFNHYYQTKSGKNYFYPIPTGGSLYQYYLKMVYTKPQVQIMNQALRLMGVSTGYLVINKYWHNSDRSINEAKLQARKWWTINQEIYIFKYQD